MDQIICPQHVRLCLLGYNPLKKELQFLTEYKNEHKPWSDTTFVLFPIFNGKGDSSSIGCVGKVFLLPNFF